MATAPSNQTKPGVDNSDPLDEVLNLENQYYNEGYNLGVIDGSRAGRTEGRIFGLEKGFEKFVEMGRLSGKVSVWSARLSTESGEGHGGGKLQPLRGSERLKKHVHRLKDLTDAETLSTENSEEAVSEFDDRLKDGKAKATLISKIIGVDDTASSLDFEGHAQSSTAPGKALRVKGSGTGKQTGEMEDFTGLPGAKKLLKG